MFSSNVKCWVVLPQGIRPAPPQLPMDTGGIGKPTGTFCPGHFIATEYKKFSHMLNASTIVPYPPHMPVTRFQEWDVSRSVDDANGLDTGPKVDIPTPHGIGIKLSAKAVFKNTVKSHEHFATLDRYTILPTCDYIRESLKDDGIAAYLRGSSLLGWVLGYWKIYMISGIIVAQGGRRNHEHSSGRHVALGGGASLPSVATVGLDVSLGTVQDQKVSAGGMDDFVWAIQLTCISKRPSKDDFEFELMFYKDPIQNFSYRAPEELFSRLYNQITETTKHTGLTDVEEVEEALAQLDDDNLSRTKVFGLQDDLDMIVVPRSARV